VTGAALTLYRWALRGGARGHFAAQPRAPRPKGPLIWLVLDHPSRASAALALAGQIAAQPDMRCLITGLDTPATSKTLLQDTAPPEAEAEALAAFLDHWSPQVVVLLGGTLRPVLAHLARARAIPLLLAEAEMPRLPQGPAWLFGGVMQDCVQALHNVLAVDEAAARAYRRLGAGHVARVGRMEAAPPPLPHNEPERAALAAAFATRPVWLAVDVPPFEEAAVLAAHRSALRRAHRLLLILMPQQAARAAELAQSIEANEGWVVARRDRDQEPDAETSVYIADAGLEYGLWYRLAPVTFLGGSLLGAGSARSPLEAAALGSAIIHGRKVGEFGREFGRLGAALGAAPISTADDLAEFLTELLAPDRVARMAHAAWGVVSEGAEVTDRIVKTVLHLAAGGR
jgi:3-deoxy-D-manno-octulosonic-acid transferase